MYFVRSGIIYLPDGSLRRAGDYGYFWSSTAYVADIRYAFNLLFYSTSTLPSTNGNRYAGFSPRLHISPIYFVRSGNIILPRATLRTAGHYSYYWSSSAPPADINYSFYFDFDPTIIVPSNGYHRYNGFSLHQILNNYSPYPEISKTIKSTCSSYYSYFKNTKTYLAIRILKELLLS